MPRPMWNGSISFGLVNIPVKMYNSVRKKTLHFHQLRAGDGCKIRLKRVCARDGQEVSNEQIVKGYEISPQRYVIVTAEELEALNPKATRTIEIEDFVNLDQIDPIYFEQSYYLVPDKGAGKAYTLLLYAMKQAGKVAIARVVLRNKQYLVTIRPAGKALSLATMHYADEIVSPEELEGLPNTDTAPDQRELTMAEKLIESLAADFNPAKYRDEYREKVLEMIEKKAEGETVVIQPATPEGGKVVDLMVALEASLAAIKKKQQAKDAKNRRRKARA
ncbi:Ku protein [Sporolituus thermophilus]|uniref:Non-homologous end joining protein Ku n=1 Tax=Sporolituus thermophilus DSM 23256 TaxID=1123285 RepID=A0A1G7KJ22_9FIRM|nr:Ku protein [Sporolituus thermophilus]SDF37202.1 DNA end-binding protein Ku [Sporolituus thermophilus DSM 23256]